MDCIQDNWFFDQSQLRAGYVVSFEIEKILFREQSDLQDIIILQSKTHGKILALDGGIVYFDHDKITYNELIVNIPLQCHPKPQKVFIIGGGTGGVVAEVLKYPDIQQVVVCEKDKVVYDAIRKYFPEESAAYDDPRVKLSIEDGVQYLEGKQHEFDVIISDNRHPTLMGYDEASKYANEYYIKIKQSLTSNGIACFQGPNTFYSLPLLKTIMNYLRQMFGNVEYCCTTQPCVENNGFTVCGVDSSTNFRQPLKMYEQKTMGWKYYNHDLHRSCFSLPTYLNKEIYDVQENKSEEKCNPFVRYVCTPIT